jgi:anti-sigma factor RsiW
MNVKWLWNKCRRYDEDLSLLAADALAEAERHGVEAHLDQCPACQVRFAELKILVGNCQHLSTDLLEIMPSAALRKRWMVTVHPSERIDLPRRGRSDLYWFSGRRVAWGTMAVIWLLVLGFRFSAPDAPRPVSLAVTPLSWREVLAALKVEERAPSFRVEVGDPSSKAPPLPQAPPPRSQHPSSETSATLRNA